LKKLSNLQAQSLIENVITTLPQEECISCECFLGYITQLEMDADESARGLIQQYRFERRNVHSCLGCDPCPPGDQYGKYLRDAQMEKSKVRSAP
jgi:hypothetical protein